jgi:DNA topoisomerase-1
MDLVIVESPAKAKTINKYLGPGYEVLASFGHVRDLPAKDGSVDPANDFRMLWEVDAKAGKRLADIAQAMKGANKLILATDPDREGEAISWHVLEVLKEKRVLKDHPVERVVFNAITKQAVTEAMKHPRAIDGALVDAYLARRALDYLVGFTLSGAVAQIARRAFRRPGPIGGAAAGLRARTGNREIRRPRILVAGRHARHAARG